MTPFLTPVQSPKLLREIWPAIRPAVERLQRKDDSGWLVDDMYAELVRFDGTYLWTTADLYGFVVLQVLASPYAKNLHVWIASNATEAGAAGFVEQLKGIAVDAGCDNITFVSDRAGWQRAVPEFQARTLYTLKIGDGS